MVAGGKYGGALAPPGIFREYQTVKNGETDNLGKTPPTAKIEEGVIPAPLWLVKRIEALRRRPPPTFETVREQWAASVAFSLKLDGKQNA